MWTVKCKNILIQNKLIDLSRRWIVSTIHRRSAKLSSSETPQNTTQKEIDVHRPLSEHEIKKIIDLKDIHIVTKFQSKLPQRPPLVKNFFIGKIDQALLTYPQMMDVKDFNEMTKKLEPISSYFSNNGNAPYDERHRDLSNQTITNLRNMKLFGSSVHQRYAGSGYFKSEMNWASESEANDIKSFLVMASHRVAVEAILDHGNTSQQNQYLMDMARGDVIGAICLHDPLNKDDTKRVTVTKSNDGDYILNGSKRFVILSQHANLLIVIAEKSEALKYECDEDENAVDDADNNEYIDSHLTFVVDPKSSGITISDERPTIGCNDVPFVTVNYCNVHVGKDQILSETSDDRKISEKLIASSRLQLTTLNMVVAKNILSQLINFAISTDYNSENLRDLQYVRENIGKLACSLYGLESMIYLTTGIIDQYDNPKIDFECMVAKAFSHDILRNITDFAMNLMNTPNTVAGHPVGLDVRDAIQLQCYETSGALKSYVGRMGIQHAVEHFGRNASDYKDSMLQKIGLSEPTIEYIESKLFLWYFLHPTFKELAEDLEFSILRLRYASEMLINRYGQSVGEQEIEIRKLGEAAMWNYAMFASIARASRAYCIGLRYSAYETILAECLMQIGSEHNLKTALDIKHNQNEFSEQHKTILSNILTHRK